MQKINSEIILYRARRRIEYQRKARLDNYLRDLSRRGYVSYYQDMDYEVCRDAKCQDCGHQGMDYIGVKGMTYVAIARCPECHYWEEF